MMDFPPSGCMLVVLVVLELPLVSVVVGVGDGDANDQGVVRASVGSLAGWLR